MDCKSSVVTIRLTLEEPHSTSLQKMCDSRSNNATNRGAVDIRSWRGVRRLGLSVPELDFELFYTAIIYECCNTSYCNCGTLLKLEFRRAMAFDEGQRNPEDMLGRLFGPTHHSSTPVIMNIK